MYVSAMPLGIVCLATISQGPRQANGQTKDAQITTQFAPKQCIEGIGLRYQYESVIFESGYREIGVLGHAYGLGEYGTVNILVLRFLQMMY